MIFEKKTPLTGLVQLWETTISNFNMSRHIPAYRLTYVRTLIESVYQKNNFLISQLKHVLWELKRTVSMSETVLLSTQNMLKLMGKKIFTILCTKSLFI